MSEVIEAVKGFFAGDKPATPDPVPPSEFPKKGSNHNGTEHAYTIEARSMFNEPQVFGKQIFDQRWKRVQFDQVAPPFGVPAGHSMVADRLGLHSYPAAQALRWWFHANAHATFSGICLESRIVKHAVSYTFSEEAVSAHEVISGEDRSNIMPDWNA